VTVGWGIVSTGRHPDVKVVPAIKQVKDAKVIAACSRDIKRAEGFAEKHDILRAYGSIEALVNDSEIDAVFISSPNALHARHTLKAAAAGKHVLVEKPMATTLDEALDMLRVSKQNGIKLGVGFHLRHHPGHHRARELIQKGVLGTISMIQGQWCFGERKRVYPSLRTGSSSWWNDPEMMGGASTLMGTGVHVIDLLYYLTGAEITEVAAITDGQTKEHPLEQVAAVCVRFNNGIMGTICAGRRMPDSENDVMIYGSHGRIALRGTVWEALCGKLEVISETENITESYDKDPLALYKNEIEAFDRAIVSDENFHASGEDGLHAVKVIRSIIESAVTGRKVNIY
jgi:1,5-anhydro-D-fructose reductase (1,5-anhydro-D-mannitol-forming)